MHCPKERINLPGGGDVGVVVVGGDGVGVVAFAIEVSKRPTISTRIMFSYI